MEILDVVDETGAPTGETVERTEAHREGVRHRTSHVWIARNRNGRIQLLLQKRCMQKDSFPGCYDTSSAGHIQAGDEPLPSAVRELSEELGIEAQEEDLTYIGRFDSGEIFHDHQISNVYLLWLDREAEEFELQTEEIESVRWMDYAQVRGMVASDTLPNCIIMEELDLIERHFL